MCPKQRSMSVRISSGSMRSAIAVEPTTSAKSTVTSLRSPSSAARVARMRAARCAGVYDDGAGGGGRRRRTHARAAAIAEAASSGSAAPHARQARASAAPQPRQNRASSRFSLPQRLHCTPAFYVAVVPTDNRLS